MSARRSSQPSVQLFPFLAVLMCALGALILLLLVITGRMRDQARARAIMSRTAAISDAALPPRPVVRPGPPPRARWQPASVPPKSVLQPSPLATTPDASHPNVSLRTQWLRNVTELQAATAADEAALASRRAAVAADEAALQALQSQLAALRQQTAALAARQADAASDRDQHAARRAELQRAVAEQEAAIENLRVQQAAAASRFSILPYDGRSGTVRRPIYIECTATGLTFASEQITLTPEQLNGFPALRNPLLAGADALVDFWSLKALREPGADAAGAPYVLLIVRPSGTVGYYVARQMLDALGQPFGYELVSEDMQLQYPPTDPAAAKACQAAIDAVLQDRDQLILRSGVVAPGSLAPLSVSDGRGAFALEEVDRLRGSGRTVHFGGRTFDRNPTHNGGPPEGVPRPRHDSARPEPAPHPFASGDGRGPSNSQAEGPSSVTTARKTPPHEGHAGSTVQPPQLASRPVAGEAAAAFSSAAGEREQSRGGVVADHVAKSADQRPRPLSPLDAEGVGSRSAPNTASRNPTDVLRDPGSAIGLERKVVVRLSSQQIVVESESPIVVLPGMSREELQAQLAQTLRIHFESWGRPPRGFYWLPQVKYSVLPGGHQHLKRLTDLTDEWEIRSDVDFTLE